MSKQSIENILRSIFSICIMISLAGGAIAFVIFIIAITIGGDMGSQLAINTKDIYIPYFIKAATIAVISGLIVFYISGSHTLSLKEEKKKENLNV